MKSHLRAGREAFGYSFVARLLPAILLASGIITNTVRADRLIGGGLFNLADLNPSTGAVSFIIDLPLYDCWNNDLPVIDSMVEHPGTGEIYGILAGVANTLITIDRGTGEVTVIGDIGLQEEIGRIASITFGAGPEYPLYAMNRGGGQIDGTISTINPATAVPTDTGWTPAGTGEHALEFNPDDGLLYHFYSALGVDGLETIDPLTGVATPVVLSGASYGSVNGIAYAGSNLFYAYDNVNNKILSITTGGFVTELSTPADSVEALEYVGSNLLAIDTQGVIFQYDPATGVQSNQVTLGVFERCSSPIHSIAKDPATNEYYVITEKDDPLGGGDGDANSLAMMDIDTGVFSNQVDLSTWGVMGITVGPSGQLYGVLGDGAPLGQGKIVTIDKVSGLVVDTGWASDQNEEDHSLEYNPDDGLLYHFYANDIGQRHIETIDPGTGNVVSVGPVSDGFPFSVQGAVYRGNDQFYILDSAGFISTVTTGGEKINQSSMPLSVPYQALELAPDRVDTARLLAIANLKKQIKKVKKAIRKAKKRGQKLKVRSLTKKLRKLKKQLRALQT